MVRMLLLYKINVLVSAQRIVVCGVVVLLLLKYLGVSPAMFKLSEGDALALRKELAHVFVQSLSMFCKKISTPF